MALIYLHNRDIVHRCGGLIAASLNMMTSKRAQRDLYKSLYYLGNLYALYELYDIYQLYAHYINNDVLERLVVFVGRYLLLILFNSMT